MDEGSLSLPPFTEYEKKANVTTISHFVATA